MYPIIFYLSHIIIESNNDNIGLVKMGITGISDDLTHDKVVILSPEIKMGYVKLISSLTGVPNRRWLRCSL